MMENIICFRTFNDLSSAYMVKGLLEENGIFSFIENENITTANPFLTNAVGGIRLMINEKDIEQVDSILNENHQLEMTNEFDKSDTIDDGINDGNLSDSPICPNCGSTNTWSEAMRLFFKRKHHCYDCNNEWK